MNITNDTEASNKVLGDVIDHSIHIEFVKEVNQVSDSTYIITEQKTHMS